jgi:hypothetical protein
MLDTIFLYAAIIGGGFLVVQLLLMFVGGDGLGDLDADAGLDLDVGPDAGDGHHGGFWFFEIISFRTLAAAAAFFGLVGLTAKAYDLSDGATISIAAAAGFAAMYGVYWLFKQLLRLQSSGNEDIRNAVGCPAQVYISIPGNQGGLGKVQLQMQSRIVEYQAKTDEADRLKPGEQVVVTDILNSDTLLVARERVEAEPVGT